MYIICKTYEQRKLTKRMIAGIFSVQLLLLVARFSSSIISSPINEDNLQYMQGFIKQKNFNGDMHTSIHPHRMHH